MTPNYMEGVVTLINGGKKTQSGDPKEEETACCGQVREGSEGRLSKWSSCLLASSGRAVKAVPLVCLIRSSCLMKTLRPVSSHPFSTLHKSHLKTSFSSLINAFAFLFPLCYWPLTRRFHLSPTQNLYSPVFRCFTNPIYSPLPLFSAEN